MKYKQFDADLHSKTDKKGKDAAIKEVLRYMPSNYKVLETENKYGVDVTVLDSTDQPYCYIEVEVKNSWTDTIWPFNCMHIPKRKGKFTNLDKKTIFITFNHDCSGYVACTDKALTLSLVKEIPNRYIKKGEYFYNVPLENLHYNNLTNLLGRGNGTSTKAKSN